MRAAQPHQSTVFIHARSLSLIIQLLARMCSFYMLPETTMDCQMSWHAWVHDANDKWRLQVEADRVPACWWCGWYTILPCKTFELPVIYRQEWWCIYCYRWHHDGGLPYYPTAIDRRTVQVHKAWPQLDENVCRLIAGFLVEPIQP